jgi:hypothetical protein
MTISGKVYSEAGHPIELANVVYVKPTGEYSSIGSSTDDAGNFRIEVPATGAIEVSHVSFQKRRIDIGSLPFIVVLKPSTYAIPEAIVEGTNQKTTKPATKLLLAGSLLWLLLLLIRKK